MRTVCVSCSGTLSRTPYITRRQVARLTCRLRESPTPFMSRSRILDQGFHPKTAHGCLTVFIVARARASRAVAWAWLSLKLSPIVIMPILPWASAPAALDSWCTLPFHALDLFLAPAHCIAPGSASTLTYVSDDC